jgi:hypothetical protein
MMVIRVRSLSVLPFLFLLIAAGCVTSEKRVDLTYARFVNTKGGSGQVFVAEPVMKQHPATLPSGGRIVGKAEGADIIVNEDPAKWLLSALVQELSAAGYEVRTVPALPAGVSKGVEPTVLTLSADQSSGVVIVTTVTAIKLEAQLWKNGQIIKTLTAGARDHEEGRDGSSEPIRSALEKTLQQAMQELIPDIVKGLE